MKELNNASLPLSFAEGKYSSESVRLPNGQYTIKIIATGPCIGKVLKDNEVLTEVDFSSYKTPYNNLQISFILSYESAISLEVTPKREDVKVYSASLSSSILPIGGDEYPTPTGTINITENGENIDVKQYAKANVAVPQPSGNIEITKNGQGIDIAQYATANVNVNSLPPILACEVTSPSGDRKTTSGVYDGLSGMPSGQDIAIGEAPEYTYGFTVIATGEVKDNLDKLVIAADSQNVFNFAGASVSNYATIGGVVYSRIYKSEAVYVQGSPEEVILKYKDNAYIAWVAAS